MSLSSLFTKMAFNVNKIEFLMKKKKSIMRIYLFFFIIVFFNVLYSERERVSMQKYKQTNK